MAEKSCCRLQVKVVPNASRDEISGWLGSAVKIKLRAPAVDGKANQALLEFIGRGLKIPARQCIILRGEHARDKVLELHGVDESDLVKWHGPRPT